MIVTGNTQFPFSLKSIVLLLVPVLFLTIHINSTTFLIGLDKRMLAIVNNPRHDFWDAFMVKVSSVYFWIPFYCFLLLGISGLDRVRFLRIISCIGAYLLISITCLMIFNIIFGHPRPLYDHPLLSGLIMWGSGMGPEQGCLPLSSVSAGLVLLIAKFFKSKHLPFTVLSILWAAVFTSSNLYNAWNYPSEILVGVTVCAAIALITFNIYKRVK